MNPKKPDVCTSGFGKEWIGSLPNESWRGDGCVARSDSDILALCPDLIVDQELEFNRALGLGCLQCPLVWSDIFEEDTLLPAQACALTANIEAVAEANIDARDDACFNQLLRGSLLLSRSLLGWCFFSGLFSWSFFAGAFLAGAFLATVFLAGAFFAAFSLPS